MPRTVSPIVLAFAFALGLTASCEKDDDDSDLTNAEACEMIIEHCHPKDDGSDETINGCHQTAHDEGDCLTGFDDCIAACDAAPAIDDGGDHGDHGDHSDEDTGEGSTG